MARMILTGEVRNSTIKTGPGDPRPSQIPHTLARD